MEQMLMKCVYSELQSCQEGKSTSFSAKRQTIWTEQYHDSLYVSVSGSADRFVSAFQNCSIHCARQITSRTSSVRWSSSTTAYGTLSCLMINGVSASLPVRDGGLGNWNSLCAVMLASSAAFLASATGTSDLQDSSSTYIRYPMQTRTYVQNVTRC